MTLRQWCSDRGRDEAHVSRVVAGKVPSAPVIAEVDAFIEAQSGNVNNAPTSAAETPSAV